MTLWKDPDARIAPIVRTTLESPTKKTGTKKLTPFSFLIAIRAMEVNMAPQRATTLAVIYIGNKILEWLSNTLKRFDG